MQDTVFRLGQVYKYDIWIYIPNHILSVNPTTTVSKSTQVKHFQGKLGCSQVKINEPDYKRDTVNWIESVLQFQTFIKRWKFGFQLRFRPLSPFNTSTNTMKTSLVSFVVGVREVSVWRKGEQVLARRRCVQGHRPTRGQQHTAAGRQDTPPDILARHPC